MTNIDAEQVTGSEWFTIVVICTTVALIGGVVLWLWRRDDPYSRAAEHMREQLLDLFDEEQDDANMATASISQVARIALAHLRTELGLLTDTGANRMVVSDATRKFMKTRGMRPTHISYHFPIVVETYFLQSSADEELALIRKSAAYRKMRRAGGATT